MECWWPNRGCSRQLMVVSQMIALDLDFVMSAQKLLT